jgi:hypothetical protein
MSLHQNDQQGQTQGGARVLAAHLRALAADCAADRDATPLDADQPPAEYAAAHSRIRAMDTSAFRLGREADRLARDGA